MQDQKSVKERVPLSDYWEERFTQEGMIWGHEPSPSAVQAFERFKEAGAAAVLVPGAGYGRHTKVFSGSFTTYGIEISPAALELAARWDPDSVFLAGSALEVQLESPVDAVYCYDVLHLFLAAERRSLIAACLAQLRSGGLLYFTCFSDEDPANGQGSMLEEGTYEYKQGKYAHFFSDEDLRTHFGGTDILETGEFTDCLRSSQDGSHSYSLRYILARKR
ncbi:class I SAM-dependent methyltransferase [Paenibacillus tepidiphilus]|uniref:class I SAM-dependent methyltransferase n=1 Tax=Paenibacillus tepidiphilus TaxID=2608683 RepID=UPI001EF16084|nr:class I SAM-dependent methyltransferase [Paenibacillus tepidiphilus]